MPISRSGKPSSSPRAARARRSATSSAMAGWSSATRRSRCSETRRSTPARRCGRSTLPCGCCAFRRSSVSPPGLSPSRSPPSAQPHDEVEQQSRFEPPADQRQPAPHELQRTEPGRAARERAHQHVDHLPLLARLASGRHDRLGRLAERRRQVGLERQREVGALVHRRRGQHVVGVRVRLVDVEVERDAQVELRAAPPPARRRSGPRGPGCRRRRRGRGSGPGRASRSPSPSAWPARSRAPRGSRRGGCGGCRSRPARASARAARRSARPGCRACRTSRRPRGRGCRRRG